jgi:transcriptional regulator with XRE-family HTH domain
MEELKRLRRARGLSQAKLAAIADLDPSTVSQIETGARRANTRTLERLATALGAEVADLFPKAQAPLPLEPKTAGLTDADPSGKLADAAVLEDIAELWAMQLARGFYDRRTLGRMSIVGYGLARNHDANLREVRETLPPHFRAQLEAAEERFADVGAQIMEAREDLEEGEAVKGDLDNTPAPADELAARREARREELLKQMRGGGQALTSGNTA